MPIKREEKKDETKTIYSKEHIAKFRKAYEACASAEEFYTTYNAIEVDDGKWTVLWRDCKGLLDKITGIPFPSNIPYAFYQELESAMHDQDARRQYAENKSLEGLIGAKTTSEAFKKTSKAIKKILK